MARGYHRSSLGPVSRDSNPSDASGCLINDRNGLVAVYARILTAANIHNLDEDRTALALRMVTHFTARGEDSELVGAGHRLCRDCPHLWEIVEAGDAAKKKRRAALDAEAAARDRA